MAGGAYVVIAIFFGLAGGVVGRMKGSSFWLWFLISGLIPFLGLAAAVLYRYDRDVPTRPCPGCGAERQVHDALCTRCGTELDFAPDAQIAR